MIKTGDIIKCADADDLIEAITELAKQDIETDFMYSHEGESGFFLKVTKVPGGEHD